MYWDATILINWPNLRNYLMHRVIEVQFGYSGLMQITDFKLFSCWYAKNDDEGATNAGAVLCL
jgi:hypothetical protein